MLLRRTTHALRTLRLPCRWQSSVDNDTFLTAEDLQGGALDVSKPLTPEEQLQDPKNPPALDYKHYQRIKGINFSERDHMMIKRREDTAQDWDMELEAMRQATENRYAITEAELAKVKSHSFTVPTADIKVDDMDITTKQGLADELSVDMPAQDYFLPQMFPHELDAARWLPKRKKGKCIFCLPDPSSQHVKDITFTNVQLLRKFINTRGMIISRRLTHNCLKHQKAVARAIRRARVIGFLCPSDNFYAPASFLNKQLGDLSKLSESSLGLFDSKIKGRR